MHLSCSWCSQICPSFHPCECSQCLPLYPCNLQFQVVHPCNNCHTIVNIDLYASATEVSATPPTVQLTAASAAATAAAEGERRSAQFPSSAGGGPFAKIATHADSVLPPSQMVWNLNQLCSSFAAAPPLLFVGCPT